MDPYGRIYMDDEEKIPAEDKARLEGYLRGRAEVDTETRLREQAAKLERGLMKQVGDVIGGRFEVVGGPVAIQGLEGCTDKGCTRWVSRETGEDMGCAGYHCPDCLARTSMCGHKCPERGEVLLSDARADPSDVRSRGQSGV